ncbi:MAG: DNA-processing protein DprA [Lachnospiraceae bacterium]|nr:DNA-processing protein DprA [Lachnospiraceae bacterium]
MEEKEIPYAQWLYRIKGLGSKTIFHLLDGDVKPSRLYQMSKEEWMERLPAGKSRLAQAMEQARTQYEPEQEYRKLLSQGIRFTCAGHESYPYLLAQIPDRPFGIYYMGRLPDEHRPSLAIIGARNCSPYGIYMAEKFGRELAEAGVQIISGMARGIDGISQQTVLENNGYSLAVLGCGADVCYPAENRKLYQRLQKQGGICSEYIPGTLPQSMLFPPRNRIISGLADGVLVIEAKQKSGTLITVDMALEQGREVFALPGRANEPLSEGCNRLLKQGACMVLDTQDILRELEKLPRFCHGITTALPERKQRKETDADGEGKGSERNTRKPGLCEIIRKVLDLTPKTVEEIRMEVFHMTDEEYSVSEIAAMLMQMELSGMVQSAGNGGFMEKIRF